MFQWTRLKVCNLISNFKQYPVLYDRQIQMHVQKSERDKAYFEICTNMKRSHPEVTLEDIEKKIKILQAQYMEEKRLRKEINEDNIADRYKPQFWCFEHLNFLDKSRVKTNSDEENSDSGSSNKLWESCTDNLRNDDVDSNDQNQVELN